ncbi:hypothetical protein BDF21DRAFT_464084 [Thamnidium elegans]|nr:hypothetical protein BDF21DRAFT_464084 [Thamnidium elegans]
METLDTVEKTSIELKTQSKERNVSKHTTEFIYSFFNEYLSNTNNVDQLRPISPYRCEKLMEINVSILEPLSYDICKNGCYMYDLEETDTICPSERCKERRYMQSNINEASSSTETLSLTIHTQLPLSKQLAYFLVSGNNLDKIRYSQGRKSLYNIDDNGNYFGERASNHLYQDFFDGNMYRKMTEDLDTPQETINLYLALHIDGFTPFKYNSRSMRIIMLTIMNLPRKERRSISPQNKRDYD